jgi:hypothetical protein
MGWEWSVGMLEGSIVSFFGFGDFDFWVGGWLYGESR